MLRQAQYDAFLVTIPDSFAIGGAVTAVTSGTLAVLAALGTAIAGVWTVGRALNPVVATPHDVPGAR